MKLRRRILAALSSTLILGAFPIAAHAECHCPDCFENASLCSECPTCSEDDTNDTDQSMPFEYDYGTGGSGTKTEPGKPHVVEYDGDPYAADESWYIGRGDNEKDKDEDKDDDWDDWEDEEDPVDIPLADDKEYDLPTP